MGEYTFKVVKPEGTYFIRIEAATPAEVYQGGSRVTVLVPLVSIATGEKWYPAEARTFVKYRGRGYAFDYTMRHIDRIENARSGRVVYWSPEGYQRSIVNDNGNEIDWKSPARDKVAAMRDAVLDEWAAEHPEWARLSERRRIEADLSSAESEAKGLRRKLNEAEAKAAALRSRLNSFRVDR